MRPAAKRRWAGGCAAAVLLWTLAAWATEMPVASVDKIRERCLGILKQALASDEAFVRSGAVRAAGDSEDPAVLPLLTQGTRDFFPTTRQFALQALRRVSPKEAVARAAGALEDSNVWVKTTALEILGEMGGRDWAPRIEPLLAAPDAMVRLAAAYALFRLGDAEQFDTVRRAADGGDAVQRYQAITYLGRIETPPAFARLTELLEKETEDEILIYTLKALESRVEIEQLRPLERLLVHKNPRVRQQAVVVMGRLPAAVALDRITPLCVDADSLVRVTAAMAAARLDSEKCREVFPVALQHPDYGVRSVAARVLGDLNIPDRAALLARALGDPNSRVRTAAVRATGRMGGAPAFPLLIRRLDDSTEVIRAYAAAHLLKLLTP